MSLEIIVSEEDFLSTYKNGMKNLRAYDDATRLRGEGQSLESIGHIIGRHQNTIRSWLNNRKPLAVKRLEEAKKLDIVPLTTQSEKLEPLNRLCAWVFLTGCITQNYMPFICENPDQLKSLDEYFGKTLDIRNRSANPAQLLFARGHTYGRVLSLMGVPIGDYTPARRLHIPHSIVRTPSSHFDFVRILFASRSYVDGNFYRTIQLPTNFSYDAARSYGTEVLDFMRKTLTRVQLPEDRLAVIKHSKAGTWMPRIALHKEDVLAIARHYPSLITTRSPEVAYADSKVV